MTIRVLVTGGLGFQGSNLSAALLAEGYHVTIFSTPSERSEQNIKRFDLEGAHIVWGSITDRDAVEKVVRDHDLIFHLAANIHVGESIDSAEKYYTTNVLGSYNVVEHCRRQRIPLIFVATCEVYGGCDLCSREKCDHSIRESCPMKPQSPYAASKAGAELLAFASAITYNQRILILRPANIYGPGQRYGARGAVIPIFVHRALAGKSIHIYGDGTQSREFVYIGDLVKAYLFLMRRFLSGALRDRVINVTNGEAVTINDIAHQIITETHSASDISHEESRPGEVKTFHLNGDILQHLGFRFGWKFEDGLRRYIQWFRECEFV